MNKEDYIYIITYMNPGARHGKPLWYSCLENPMDRGAWLATVHRVQRVGHDWSNLANKHIYIYIKFNHEKEGNSAICDIMDGPWGHYAKWSRSDSDIMYVIYARHNVWHYVWDLKKKFNSKKQIQMAEWWLPGAEEWE